jgi:hypothetical protein
VPISIHTQGYRRNHQGINSPARSLYTPHPDNISEVLGKWWSMSLLDRQKANIYPRQVRYSRGPLFSRREDWKTHPIIDPTAFGTSKVEPSPIEGST